MSLILLFYQNVGVGISEIISDSSAYTDFLVDTMQQHNPLDDSALFVDPADIVIFSVYNLSDVSAYNDNIVNAMHMECPESDSAAYVDSVDFHYHITETGNVSMTYVDGCIDKVVMASSIGDAAVFQDSLDEMAPKRFEVRDGHEQLRTNSIIKSRNEAVNADYVPGPNLTITERLNEPKVKELRLNNLKVK